jgi:hypothetical protein
VPTLRARDSHAAFAVERTLDGIEFDPSKDGDSEAQRIAIRNYIVSRQHDLLVSVGEGERETLSGT